MKKYLLAKGRVRLQGMRGVTTSQRASQVGPAAAAAKHPTASVPAVARSNGAQARSRRERAQERERERGRLGLAQRAELDAAQVERRLARELADDLGLAVFDPIREHEQEPRRIG